VSRHCLWEACRILPLVDDGILSADTGSARTGVGHVLLTRNLSR
jgi:hypothetical protein